MSQKTAESAAATNDAAAKTTAKRSENHYAEWGKTLAFAAGIGLAAGAIAGIAANYLFQQDAE